MYIIRNGEKIELTAEEVETAYVEHLYLTDVYNIDDDIDMIKRNVFCWSNPKNEAIIKQFDLNKVTHLDICQMALRSIEISSAFYPAEEEEAIKQILIEKYGKN